MLWERLPLIGGPLRATRLEATRAGIAALTRVTELVLEQIDLTTLVRDQLDMDAVLADLDVEAIVGRIDLNELADQIVAEMDLPAVLRSCTATVASAENFVDRMLGWETKTEEPR
jgi:hypothetical protein